MGTCAFDKDRSCNGDCVAFQVMNNKDLLKETDPSKKNEWFFCNRGTFKIEDGG